MNNISSTTTLCIPKVSASLTESKLRLIIDSTLLGSVYYYKEIPWKFNRAYKRILFTMNWNPSHDCYTEFTERLNHNHSIQIIDYPDVYFIYKFKPSYKFH